jgi:hypothetical protein
MTTEAITVVGGVDTHKHTHYAAALDQHGRLLGNQKLAATVFHGRRVTHVPAGERVR